MKTLLSILFIFILTTTHAQTYTTKQLSDSMRVLRKRMDAKDKKDEERNTLIKALTVKVDMLQKKLDSAGVYLLSSQDFIIDNNRTAWIKPKKDTVIISH